MTYGTVQANAIQGSINTFSPNSAVFRNRIINGAMVIWQRGTPVTTSGGYTADRWTQVSGNSIVHTQSTDAPTGFTNSLQMAGTGSNIAQRIESVNCIGLGGATVTVSLWYKNSTGSDSLSLSLYYANSTDSFGSVTQIGSNQTLAASPSSSWTYYTATFTNISANAINGLALYIFRGSSATATGLLTGVQLEVGSTATSFDYRPYGTELALCQRYFQIPSKLASSDNYFLFGTGYTINSTSAYMYVKFTQTMRTNPTMTYSAANTFAVHTGSSSVVSCTAMGTERTTSDTAWVTATVASGLTTGYGVFLIGNNSSSAKIEASAEL